MNDMSGSINFYELLGVAPGASQEDIKRAYDSLVKNNGEHFLYGRVAMDKVHRVYEILSNAELRSRYDQQIAMPQANISSNNPKFIGPIPHFDEAIVAELVGLLRFKLKIVQWIGVVIGIVLLLVNTLFYILKIPTSAVMDHPVIILFSCVLIILAFAIAHWNNFIIVFALAGNILFGPFLLIKVAYSSNALIFLSTLITYATSLTLYGFAYYYSSKYLKGKNLLAQINGIKKLGYGSLEEYLVSNTGHEYTVKAIQSFQKAANSLTVKI